MSKEDNESPDRAEYDPQADTFRASYRSDEPYSLIYTIIDLVAVATDRRQEMMKPLFDVVDPDALEQLFRLQNEQTIRVEFTYLGCEITVRSDEVTVRV